MLVEVYRIRMKGASIDLTPQEVDVLASLVEMCSDGAGVTFGEWWDCNPDLEGSVNSASEKMNILWRASHE